MVKSFNNDHYDLIYKKWYEYFDKLQMFNFYKLNKSKSEIIICGIFKIRRNKNKQLLLKKYVIKSNKWVPISTKSSNSPINLTNLKLFQTSVKYTFEQIMKDALKELFSQCTITNQEKANIEGWQIEQIFIKTKLKFTKNKENFIKAFIREFHEHFVKKEVYSFCCKIFQEIPSLKQYSYVDSLDLKSLQRIEKENKNLLPLVAYLPADKIIESDIFSKKNWVIGHDKDKSMLPGGYHGYYRYYRHYRTRYKYNQEILKFETTAHWRFFKSLPVTSTIYIYKYCFLSKIGFDLLLRINNIRNQQVYIINALVKLISLICLTNNFNEIDMKKYGIFLNICLNDILKRKKLLSKSDFRSFIDYFVKDKKPNNEDIYTDASLFFDGIYDILDYFAHEMPNLNKNSTFNSIFNLTRKWEDRISKLQINKNRKWKSLSIDYEYDNFSVKEIDNEYELNQEGKEMHHCVYSYIDNALKEQYRIFSIKGTTTQYRATLGIERVGENWELNQVRGYCNSTVPEDVLLICNDIVHKINNSVNSSKVCL